MESRFFEPSIFFNHGTFPLGLLQTNTVMSPPLDFLNPRFVETPNISNQFLPPMKEICKKFTFDFSYPQESTTEQLSFEWPHVRIFLSVSKGRTPFYYTVNSTKESTAHCLSIEWSLSRPGSRSCRCCLLCVQGGSNILVLGKILKYVHSNEGQKECHGISVCFPGCYKTIPRKSSVIWCHL